MCHICQEKETNIEMANVRNIISLKKKGMHFGKGENIVKKSDKNFELN